MRAERRDEPSAALDVLEQVAEKHTHWSKVPGRVLPLHMVRYRSKRLGGVLRN